MIKNVISVLRSNLWVLIIGLFNGLVIPKVLPINEYANYSLFTLYISYIVALHLGFPSGMFIKYGGKNHNSIEKSQYKSELLLLYLILLVFTILGIVMYLCLKEKYCFYISMAILPVCIVSSYKSLYQAWGMFPKYSRLNMIIPSSIVLIVIGTYIVKGTINADLMIIIYLTVYSLIAVLITIQEFKFINKSKANKVFSKENWEIEKIGFTMMIGNYVNVLFNSMDKMFINIFFTQETFAIYAFAMQMQIIMTIFISAISQPLYYKLSLKDNKNDFTVLKELLMIFGSFSGTAYFACSIVVNNFIPKYSESLEVIAIYFAVFPVLTVITSLYINLYKINKMMKKYIKTLIMVVLIAFILNFIGILIFKNYLVVVGSTTAVYYIWFFYSSRHFDDIFITSKDTIYLIGFLILFFSITKIESGLIGILVYSVVIIIYGYLFYGKSIKKMVKLFSERRI